MNRSFLVFFIFSLFFLSGCSEVIDFLDDNIGNFFNPCANVEERVHIINLINKVQQTTEDLNQIERKSRINGNLLSVDFFKLLTNYTYFSQDLLEKYTKDPDCLEYLKKNFEHYKQKHDNLLERYNKLSFLGCPKVNCDSFQGDWQKAQNFYEICLATNLDRDNNGIACEKLLR